jgi:hypothetical protein
MDAYQVLGLAPSASLDDAEDAYRRLLRLHHPDLHQHDSPDALAAAELRTRALNAAIRQIRAGARVHTTVPSAAHDAPAWSGPATVDLGDDPPLVACPLCGEWFATAPSLKAHVTTHHELRLDRRHRARRRRRHQPMALWVLMPLNAGLSLALARAADMVLHDLAVTLWVVLLSLAPSIIRVVSGDPR